ncbi:MAG: aspartate 1-decarboxylase [Planctomycetes bacterium]|nr:aspartate 1-decarboxylase [Planctomycetota bacterium]
MQRILLKSKIHRATVTQAELHYVGSVTIDQALMDAANIVEFEQVQVYDITNGNRLTTYAIGGPRGSGVVCINGAAAHRIHPRDLVIIASYAQYDAHESSGHRATIVHVNERNEPTQPAH